MKTGRSLVELAQEIERQKNVKKDLLVDTRSLALNAGDEMKLEVRDTGRESLLPLHAFGVGEIAHQQLAQFTGVPLPYYKRMMSNAPDLLADNVNRWLTQEPKRRMVRTLDGDARAILSDRYRCIDNYQIAETVLPILADIPGVNVVSCEITERRLYIKVVNPRMEGEVVPGDIVQAGIQISNSEVGLGSVQILPLVYRLVCTNGMTVNDAAQCRKHVGRINAANDDFSLFESDTIRADNHAFMLKVRDTVKAVSEQVHFDRVITMMREAKQAAITTDIPAVVELTAKDYGLTKDEGSGVLDHLIRGGDLSLFGLANAITRHSQDVSSYDRASDLEGIGYEVLSMSGAQWRRLNEAAA